MKSPVPLRPTPDRVELRAVAHDLGSVLAAVTTNLEFITGHVTDDETGEAAREVACCVGLVGEVLSLLTAETSEEGANVDLKAVLWLAQRRGVPVRVDPTEPAVVVHVRWDAVIDVLERLLPPGRSPIVQVTATATGLTLTGAHPTQAHALTQALGTLGLRGRVDGEGRVVLEPAG